MCHPQDDVGRLVYYNLVYLSLAVRCGPGMRVSFTLKESVPELSSTTFNNRNKSSYNHCFLLGNVGLSFHARFTLRLTLSLSF